MAYASVDELETRLGEPLSERERAVAEALLEDAACIIDETVDVATCGASVATLRRVSCSMVKRALLSETGEGPEGLVPLGMPQPFALTSVYGNAGDLYLTGAERSAIEGSGGQSVVSFARIAR